MRRVLFHALFASTLCLHVVSETTLPVARPGEAVLIHPEDLSGYFPGGRALFVEYYSKTCQRCQEFAQTWREVASLISSDVELKNCVVIAALNGYSFPQFAAQEGAESFPHLRWYPSRHSEDTAPASYEGPLSLTQIMHFIRHRCHYAQVGRVFAFDILAQQFTAADGGQQQQALLDRLGSAAARMSRSRDQSSAEYYRTVMEKVLAEQPPDTKAFLEELRGQLAAGVENATATVDDLRMHLVIDGFLTGPRRVWEKDL